MTAESTGNDPEFERAVADLKLGFDNKPFHKFIGLTLEDVRLEQVLARIKRKPELVGNELQGTLHGGVIASVIDAVAGAMAMVSAREKMKGLPAQEQLQRYFLLATVDMRVDYLKPGKGGDVYTAVSEPLRAGKRILVNRTNMFDENENLIATGTSTFLY